MLTDWAGKNSVYQIAVLVENSAIEATCGCLTVKCTDIWPAYVQASQGLKLKALKMKQGLFDHSPETLEYIQSEQFLLRMDNWLNGIVSFFA